MIRSVGGFTDLTSAILSEDTFGITTATIQLKAAVAEEYPFDDVSSAARPQCGVPLRATNNTLLDTQNKLTESLIELELKGRNSPISRNTW